MIIPVVFYHDGNQEYLQYAINSAEKYNNEVVLLGNKKNKHMCKQWYDTDDFDKTNYRKFEKVYVHLSSNSRKFEITAFKKYFILLEYLKKSGKDMCVLLDSDILTYINFSDINFIDSYKASISKPINQGEYDWVASGHTFLCTLDSLIDFTDFLIETYEMNLNILKEKYNWHLTNNIKGGICDMTLLYLWEKNKKGIFNWLEDDRYIIDHSIQTSSHFKQNQFQMDRLLRIKKIKFIDGSPYFYDINKKQWMLASTLHFQGSAKVLMKYYVKNTTYHKKFLCRYKEYFMRVFRIKKNINKT